VLRTLVDGPPVIGRSARSIRAASSAWDRDPLTDRAGDVVAIPGPPVRAASPEPELSRLLQPAGSQARGPAGFASDAASAGVEVCRRSSGQADASGALLPGHHQLRGGRSDAVGGQAQVRKPSAVPPSSSKTGAELGRRCAGLGVGAGADDLDASAFRAAGEELRYRAMVNLPATGDRQMLLRRLGPPAASSASARHDGKPSPVAGRPTSAVEAGNAP
jgi:hypothetical protein